MPSLDIDGIIKSAGRDESGSGKFPSTMSRDWIRSVGLICPAVIDRLTQGHTQSMRGYCFLQVRGALPPPSSRPAQEHSPACLEVVRILGTRIRVTGRGRTRLIASIEEINWSQMLEIPVSETG